MAVDLERHLKRQIQELPEDHPDRSFLFSALMATQLHLAGVVTTQEVLSGQFASKVNVVGTHVPSPVKVSRLVEYGSDRNRILVDHELEPWQYKWRLFMRSLAEKELSTFNAMLARFGQAQSMVGEIRELPIEKLIEVRNIGIKSAVFAKLAFLEPNAT